jgi:hypothetical protein
MTWVVLSAGLIALATVPLLIGLIGTHLIKEWEPRDLKPHELVDIARWNMEDWNDR